MGAPTWTGARQGGPLLAEAGFPSVTPSMAEEGQKDTRPPPSSGSQSHSPKKSRRMLQSVKVQRSDFFVPCLMPPPASQGWCSSRVRTFL